MNFQAMQTTDVGRWWQWPVYVVCMAVVIIAAAFVYGL